MTTTAETLRSAARLMREKAQAASKGPWRQMCMGSEGCSVINDGHLRERRHVAFSGRKEWKADHADAGYIASWHPLVAEEVASWLEIEAAAEERNLPDDSGTVHVALRIARTYLGETEEAAP